MLCPSSPRPVRPTFPSPALRRSPIPWLRLSTLLVVSLLMFGAPAVAEAKPKTHTVYAGQRLGSIAKRYNVTVDELCRANGITRSSTIRPGQKLIIPGTDDGQDEGKSKSKSDSKNEKSPPRPQGKTRVHVVAKGHTLSAIAGRYAITVSSLCNANGMSRNASLSVGQKLIIPHKTDKGGEYARKQRLRGDFDGQTKDEPDDEKEDKKSRRKSGAKKTWEPYVKPAWRRGFIKIRRYGRYWEGYVIGPKNEVLGHASNKINFVLGARSDGPRIDAKLIRLIASVSDKFGGREMRIVSGYRTKSFVAASKHKQGKALDFSIPGIPNDILRDYLRSLEDVGVGYYPNSSFVHLDVRGYNSYWIDQAGPGEAPRIVGKSKKKRSSAGKKKSDRNDEDEDGSEEQHEPDQDDDSDGASQSKTDDSSGSQSKTDDSSGSQSKTDDSSGSQSKTDDSSGSQSKSDNSSSSKSKSKSKSKTDDSDGSRSKPTKTDDAQKKTPADSGSTKKTKPSSSKNTKQ